MWKKKQLPVLREIKIGGLFIPLIQSLAESPGVVPTVSGYKSSWNWSLWRYKRLKWDFISRKNVNKACLEIGGLGTYFSRHNHRNRFAHSSSRVELVKPENLARGCVDSPFWHHPQSSLRISGYKLTEIVQPWRFVHNFVIANVSVALKKLNKEIF